MDSSLRSMLGEIEAQENTAMGKICTATTDREEARTETRAREETRTETRAREETRTETRAREETRTETTDKEETRTEAVDMDRRSGRDDGRQYTDSSTSTTRFSVIIKAESSSHHDRVASPFISTIKEEPLPNQKENCSGANISTPRCPRLYDEALRSFEEDNIPATAKHQLTSCPTKEEPQPGHSLPGTNLSTLAGHRCRFLSCVKVEPKSSEGEDLRTPQTKVESFSGRLGCSSPMVDIKQEPLPCGEVSLQHNDISNSHVQCSPAAIKKEPQSPDGENPTNMDIKEEEEEDYPHGGIHILEGTITDSDIHSFTITGEYIEGIEIKLKTKPMQNKMAPTSQLSSKTMYGCPVCKRSFSNHGNLVRHRETHKGKKMTCSECGADFCNKTDLMAHARIHKANRVLYCSECNITFPSNSHLIIHQRIHTGEKPFACSHCGKRFSSKSNVAEHMKVHTGSKQFYCSACGKSYARQENLISHQRIHQETATLTCAHCSQCFVDEHKFARHQRFHTLDKPYACILCGKRFAHKALLLRHERTHVSGNPVCADCGKSFYRQAELTKHRRAHQGVPEKLFKCSECGKRFSSGPRLLNHQKLHAASKAYECSECGNCFKQKNNLVRHRRVHEVEKPFWCAECERGFTTRSNLKVHRRVHIMRRQHPCPHCGKEFPFKSRLNEHLKSHEENKTDEGPKVK